MPPIAAIGLWFVLLVALLRFDPAKDEKTSPALWIPLIWIFIIASRLPSQWLGGGSVASAAEAMQEGNPLDRVIFSFLILLALVALFSRSFNWNAFFVRNFVLMLFLGFALASVFWSDYPLVALKRWFRDFGNYLVVLVALSDPSGIEGLRTLFRRLFYLLVPLSIVLIKYYPGIAKGYSQWTGAAEFMGAATSKNMLGVVCLVSGVYFFWDTVVRWPDRKDKRTKRILQVNVAFMAMTLWLLNLASSATSTVCLVIGCLVVVAANMKTFRRQPALLKFFVPACFILYLILAFGFNMNGEFASQVGRDPTLTDRTAIWRAVLNVHTNPLVGTGYESFWLGGRLKYLWQQIGGVNEAHNGYLEVYLNLGIIGVTLIAALLLSAFRSTCKMLSARSSLASLYLALWTIVLFYNMTEAAFRAQLMWLTFLLIAITVPERTGELAQHLSPIPKNGVAERFRKLPMEPVSRRRPLSWSPKT